MNMNNIGKFQMRSVLNEFDATLIRCFGVSMLDAAVTRIDALNACSEYASPSQAAQMVGLRRGLPLLAS